MNTLETTALTLGYKGRSVLQDLRLAVRPGSVLALAGPNGAGKTTLLRALARLLRPTHGAVLLDGRDVWALSERETARYLGLVPQGEASEWPLTVEQVVTLGRAPHRGWFMPYSAADRAAVDAALAQTGLAPLRERLLSELSGGERQRVLIARALAQQPQTILLDEPTAHLDLRYQGAVLGLARRLAHERGLALVMSLHDLNLAALYADRVALIADGGLVAEGSPETVLTASHLQRAYGVPVTVGRHPAYGTPLVMPVAED
jgi:iron complex transport system ATP-binding protein